jgi:AbrB family looped-hinge helix DNA binding protein
MKTGIITSANEKGQVVIPKNFRDLLGIDPSVFLNLTLRGRGIYIHPVDEVVTKEEKESSYLDLLGKTQGTWEKDNWLKIRELRKKKELFASKKRKKSW